MPYKPEHTSSCITLPNLCCCYHWKPSCITFRARFDAILRNSQAEARDFVSCKETCLGKMKGKLINIYSKKFKYITEGYYLFVLTTSSYNFCIQRPYLLKLKMFANVPSKYTMKGVNG